MYFLENVCLKNSSYFLLFNCVMLGHSTLHYNSFLNLAAALSITSCAHGNEQRSTAVQWDVIIILPCSPAAVSIETPRELTQRVFWLTFEPMPTSGNVPLHFHLAHSAVGQQWLGSKGKTLGCWLQSTRMLEEAKLCWRKSGEQDWGPGMFFNNTSASPRKSFSVPININLQGARRRQTR